MIVAAPSTVRLIGFYAGTTEQQVRDLCAIYKINPSDVHVDHVQAELTFTDAMQAEHAQLVLNKKKIKDQKKNMLAVKLG